MVALRAFERAIFESAQDIILIAPFTPEGRPGSFVRANPYACERLGYTLEQLQGLTPFDITTNRPPAMLDELRTTGVTRGEMLFVSQAGAQLPGEFIIRKVEIEGQPFLLAIVRDISERFAAREANEALLRELSTPILRVSPEVLAMPVIGEVNSERAELMTQRLLDAITRDSPGRFVLDLTGMHGADAITAGYIGKMILAARLLGTECVLAGISARLARTLTEFDALPPTTRVFATLADALAGVKRKRQ